MPDQRQGLVGGEGDSARHQTSVDEEVHERRSGQRRRQRRRHRASGDAARGLEHPSGCLDGDDAARDAEQPPPKIHRRRALAPVHTLRPNPRADDERRRVGPQGEQTNKTHRVTQRHRRAAARQLKTQFEERRGNRKDDQARQPQRIGVQGLQRDEGHQESAGKHHGVRVGVQPGAWTNHGHCDRSRTPLGPPVRRTERDRQLVNRHCRSPLEPAG